MNLNHPRRGVTIAETLMAGAIGAAMLGLLLPAISASIANSQGSRCRNNLARLAQGLSAYHDARGNFPASMEASGGSFYAASSPPNSVNWIVRVLPYIGEQALYDGFVFAGNGRILASYDSAYHWPDGKTGRPINGSSLRTDDPVRGTAIDVPGLRCTADTGFNSKFRLMIAGSSFNPQPNNYQLWARGNYGANACMTWAFAYPNSTGTYPNPLANAPACGAPDQDFWKLTSPVSWKTRGVMGANVGLSRSQITDGSGKTILIGELRGGLNFADIRGSWAYGSVGASSVWHHGMEAPNDCVTGDYMGALASAALTAMGGANSTANHQLAQQQCMPIFGESDHSVAVAASEFRSQHSGGIFVAMCDGSVRFISDSVDHGTLGGFWENAALYGGASDAVLLGTPGVPAQFRTWERLNASGDSLVVDDTTDANFSTTVVPYVLGDMNGDGVLDNFDISAFELALADPAAYLSIYPEQSCTVGYRAGRVSRRAWDVSAWNADPGSSRARRRTGR